MSFCGGHSLESQLITDDHTWPLVDFSTIRARVLALQEELKEIVYSPGTSICFIALALKFAEDGLVKTRSLQGSHSRMEKEHSG